MLSHSVPIIRSGVFPRRPRSARMIATISQGVIRVTESAHQVKTLSTSEMGMIAHLYRGEVCRSTIWRSRLDNTTNCAVVTTGIALPLSCHSTNASPLPLILAVQAVAYIGKLLIHPGPLNGFGELFERAAIGPIPGEFVILTGVLFHCGRVVLALVTFAIDRRCSQPGALISIA